MKDWDENTQEKNPASVKKWKVPGIKCIYGKTKNLLKKALTKKWKWPWWISTTNSSMFPWWIQVYEYTKWMVDDAVESHPSGILFYWKLKSYGKYFVFFSTAIF